jgi:hypothetical protein
MRLIRVAAIQRETGPFAQRRLAHQSQKMLETDDARQGFWRETRFSEELSLELSRAPPDAGGELSYARLAAALQDCADGRFKLGPHSL